MSNKAWEVMNEIVNPKIMKPELDVEVGSTIRSNKDWDNGVALVTNKGLIHVLGNGEIIDENNVLKLR
jgi:hypothetical protein